MEVKVFVTPSAAGARALGREASYPPSTGFAPTASATASVRAAGSTTERVSDVPGRSDFLQLLTTQLRYQDPLKPVQDHEFIAQLAQFSTLEELQGLNRRMDEMARLQLWVSGMGQASTLIGRQVTLDLPDGTSLTGRVEAVQMKDDVPYVKIGDGEYPVTWVSVVT